jgi:hypothetical protein
MRSLSQLAASDLSNLPDKPDETDGPSSGLSRAPSGQQPEPDDDKPLTDAGYSGHRRVRRVSWEGMSEGSPGSLGKGVGPAGRGGGRAPWRGQIGGLASGCGTGSSP